jgi:aspartyl-tRNA(Asn)/glutamyl-tRNA(Gln) amidotransferase subunit A
MLTLLESAEQIRTRKLSPIELTCECLTRIERLNPTLNSFITVTDELALAQAQWAEEEISAGNYRSPLHGIPFALKDNIDTACVRTTAGSNQYRERIPSEDAEIVRRLKLAGAVIVGKANMHEFAFGGSGVISAFGPARNPWDAARITGGSSSGAAAAVAAGMCIAAIGTDTAGSIRCPAALCNLVGHRPSQGLLSNAGTIPLAESFDTPGPITRAVADAIEILRVLAPVGCPSLLAAPTSLGIKQLKVGLARDLSSNLDAEVGALFEEAARSVSKLVAGVSDVKLSYLAAWQVRNFEIHRYHAEMMQRSPELYDLRTLDRLRSITSIAESTYVAERNQVNADLAANPIFDQVDIVLSPTVPVPAPLLSDLEAMDSAALRTYELQSLLANTFPFSFLWWPSVSVPCGFTKAGLPAGLQISGRPGKDLQVLQLAEAYEQATAWPQRMPTVQAAPS